MRLLLQSSVCALKGHAASASGQPSQPPEDADTQTELLRKDVRGLISDLRAKDKDLRVMTKTLLAMSSELREKNAQIYKLEALRNELQKLYAADLRLARAVCLRSALQVLLRSVFAKSKKGEEQLLALLSTSLGLATLDCCNAIDKVQRDHGNQPHSLDTLAKELNVVKRQLHSAAYPGRDAQSYRDANDTLVVSGDGLSASHVKILACLFEAHCFPVRIED